MSVSLRTMPDSERQQREADIAARWADARPHLSEHGRRIWLGTEAKRLGYGGIKFVAAATGAAINTVTAGVADLGKDPGELHDEGGPRRVRRPGGGRKKAEDKDPELPAVLEKLLEGEGEAGDPMTPQLRWTSKSLDKLSDELAAQGHEASPAKVRGLMRQAGWRLQSNNKSAEKRVPHEDRDPQFRYINRLTSAFVRGGLPVVSIDAKKKELVGNFANGGREWAPAGQAPSTTGLDLHRLKTQAPPEMGGAGVCLVRAAPGGPAKALVDGLVVFADEVEQAADLAEGEADQAPGRAGAARGGVLCLFRIFRVFCSVSWLRLSTGSGSPFWIHVS